MPFLDRDWENFQRDCDFFPAYTDYLFGLDTRPEVADQPGLHPQIYDPPPRRVQRIQGLPQQAHRFAAYDPVRDATRTSMHSQPSSLLGGSMLESRLPTPTPALRVLPSPDQPAKLLCPGELAADPEYSFFPQHELMNADKNIRQAWSILNSAAIPSQKQRAMSFLNDISVSAAVKRQEYQHQMLIDLQAQEAQAPWELNSQNINQEDYTYYNQPTDPNTQPVEAWMDQTTEQAPQEPSSAYAVHDISQLAAYVSSRLTQLWTCTDIVALQHPSTNEIDLNIHQQAQAYLITFRASVPPEGRQWVSRVMDKMLELRKLGADPLTALDYMPSVYDVDENSV